MKKIILILILLLESNLFGQACCTAGTPLLSSLETSSTPFQNLQIGLSYRYNSIASIYINDSQLDENSRERLSQTLIFQIDYGIWRNVSITALFSYVQHERIVLSPLGGENLLDTKGIGDALLLVKYNVIPLNILDEMEFSVGGGVKVPFGESQLTSNGLLIPADMQPGSGSWDFLGWLYFSKGRLFDLPLTVVSNLSYRINGTNNRFEVEGFDYKFGNETIAQVGLAYKTDFISDYSLFLRYRNAQADISRGFQIPNTGGDWVYLVPGINFKIDNSKTVRLSGEIPLYINVNGTQLTTSFTTTLAFYYSINL